MTFTPSTVFPGRWNRPRDAVLYTYERLATAVLEALVGCGGLLRPNLHYVALSVPFGVFYETADAAAIAGWDADPPIASVTFDAAWLNGKALLLFAPSVVLHTLRGLSRICGKKCNKISARDAGGASRCGCRRWLCGPG